MASMNEAGGIKFTLKAVFDKSALTDAAKQIHKDVQRADKAWRAFGDTMKRAERMQANFTDRWKAGFTRGVLTSLDRGENGFQRLGNGISVAAQAFEKIHNPAEKAALAFQSVQRKGFALQAGLGVLSSTLGSIAGGFLSLVAVAGQAAGSMYAIVGAISAFAVGGIVAKIALGGVGKAVGQLWQGQQQYNQSLRDAKRAFRDLRFQAEELALSEEEAAINLEKARETLARVQDLPPDNRTRREAELAYKQAELNYRKVKAAAKDANADIKRGNSAKLNQIDPFRSLTASQKTFAKYLLTTKSAVMQLKESAAGSFLPPLQKAIQGFVTKVFPTLNNGFKEVGAGMGSFVKQFADAFHTPKNLKNLDKFFKNARGSLELFGKAAGSGVGALLSMLTKLKPLTDQLAKWLDKYFAHLDDYFSSKAFDDFLATAQMVATSLGTTFHNVFGGISNLMKAAFPANGKGGGNLLLEWLNKITEGFKKFTGSKDFGNWLRGATDNATTALSTLGQFLHIFLDLAAAPETKEFWTILRGAVEPVKNMLKAGVIAGPSFARLIVAISKLLEIFLADSGAMTTFFDTLTNIVNAIKDVLKPLQPFLNILGKIHGFFLAIAVSVLVFNKTMTIISGTMSLFFKNLGQLGGRFATLGKGIKRVAIANSEVWWGFKSGVAGNIEFARSMWNSYKGTEKLKAGLDGVKSKFGAFKGVINQARVDLSTGLGLALERNGTRLLKFRNDVESVATTINKKFSAAADIARTKAIQLANAVERTSGRMVKAFEAANRRNFMPAIPVEKTSRRIRNRAAMATMAAGDMPMSTTYNKELLAEQAAANARRTIRGRLHAAITAGEARLDAFTARRIIASQDYRARLEAAGYSKSMSLVQKFGVRMNVFRQSQLAADMQFYARRAKFNVINPTWLTGPIKTATKASAAYTAKVFRDTKYRTWIAKEEAKEYLAGVGRKIAGEAQWIAYRTKHNFRNPTWIKNEVSSFLTGVKQKIAGQNIFDVKRRASALEQIRYSATNLKYTVKESKAYEAVGTAVDKAKGKLAGLASLARRGFGALSGGAAAVSGPLTGRQFVTNQMATMRAGNMPSSGNPYAASPANSQIASSIQGTAKTIAQQKAMESSYTGWWSSQLTLRARIRRQLEIRGMFEEGKSLEHRLSNVIRSATLEAAVVGSIKRTQFKAAVTNIAAETREYVAATATKVKYDLIYQAGKAQRALVGLKTVTIPQIRQEVAAFATATQEKIAHKIREVRANGRWTVATFRAAAARYKADVVEFAAATRAKTAGNITYYKGVAARAVAGYKEEAKWALYRAKANIMNPTWFTGPMKNIQARVGNSMKNLWGNVQNASLNAAKKSRMSWAASLGASEKELKKLAAELQKVKTRAELKGNSLIGSMTPGYGGVRGTMGRLNGRFGGAAMGVGMAASMLGPQTKEPGVGSFLGGAGMVASMIPGGQLIGAGLGIAGAIANGFQAAAEADAEKKRVIEAKKLEIKARTAEVNAERLAETRGGIQTLIDQFGMTFADAGQVLNDFTAVVGNKITDVGAAFTSFAPLLAGKSRGQQNQMTAILADATQDLLGTGVFADQNAVTEKLASVMKEGFKGVTGIAAVNKYMAQFRDPTTGRSGTLAPNASGQILAVTGDRAITEARAGMTEAIAATKREIGSLVEYKTQYTYDESGYSTAYQIGSYTQKLTDLVNQRYGTNYDANKTDQQALGETAAGALVRTRFATVLKEYQDKLLAQREVKAGRGVWDEANNYFKTKYGNVSALTSANTATTTMTVTMPPAMVTAQTTNAKVGTSSLKVNQQHLISAVATERHLSNLVDLTKNPNANVTAFKTSTLVSDQQAATAAGTDYLPYGTTTVQTALGMLD